MVQLLLEGGADLNKFDMFGKTPLTYGINAGHETVVKCLLDHGANPYWAVNNSGQKPRSLPDTKVSIRAMLEEAEGKQ
jgi:ankyrin repeat protein